jgi:signal transduction histidine kinase
MNRMSSQTLSRDSSAEAIEDLTSIFKAYNQTADRMNRSHDQLQAEVIRLRHELGQKNEQLQRKSRLAALGEMAAAIAHEIRNPLGAVQLYASLLEKDLVGQETPLDWVKKISNGVRSMDQIVNDVLTFAQDQPCSKTEIQLTGLMVEVIDYVLPQMCDNRITIHSDGIAKDFSFNGDVNMMRQILLNLILNATDALGDEGDVYISASYQGKDSSYAVELSVADTGQGIRSQNLDKIFNPFFTTKETGIGLGLAIVHRLVECHGGMITAGTNRFGGATFTLLLP